MVGLGLTMVTEPDPLKKPDPVMVTVPVALDARANWMDPKRPPQAVPAVSPQPDAMYTGLAEKVPAEVGDAARLTESCPAVFTAVLPQ